jgi:hypothetical protein
VSPKTTFWFYLAATVCFVLAAMGENWRYGLRTRRGLKPALTLLPLGLALWLFPLLWNTGEQAF